MASQTKYKIIDTNVWLTDPEKALFSFRPKEPDVTTYLVIPIVVLEELDRIKIEQTERGRMARHVSRIFNNLRDQSPGASFSKAIPISDNYFIKIVTGLEKEIEYTFKKSDDAVRTSFPSKDASALADNRILTIALAYQRKYCSGKDQPAADVELVTQDTILTLKADTFGIPAKDWEDIHAVKDITQFYRGYRDITVSKKCYDYLHEQATNNRVKYSSDDLAQDLGTTYAALHNNEFVRIIADNTGESLLGKRHPKGIGFFARTKSDVELFPFKSRYPVHSIYPRNYQQAFALEALLDDSIDIVHLIGSAGTGKTLLALAVALDKLKHDSSLEVIVTKPIIPVGPSIGYLPGTQEEKLRPWNQGIVDNLYRIDPKLDVARLIQNETLTLQALETIRGRSIHKGFYLVDEAQNLTPHEVKTLITRMADGSKIVLAGDPTQVDHPALNTFSTGILHSSERLKKESISATVYLEKGERGKLATIAAELL